MMMENIPFFHTLSIFIATHATSPDHVIPTIMVTYAISTVLCGFLFYLLGAMKMGL